MDKDVITVKFEFLSKICPYRTDDNRKCIHFDNFQGNCQLETCPLGIHVPEIQQKELPPLTAEE